jgi:prophage tail gpP-like protein
MSAFELRVAGETYSGWKQMQVTRGLEQATSTFELAVSERWPLLEEATAWQIKPGDSCEIFLDGDLVLTGYVEKYAPAYSGTSHDISCTGRSKTCDFVDASVMGTDGQYKGLTPGQLARELAQPFGLDVVVQFDGEPIPDAQIQQGETCFAMVERLSRLQEILITDDPQGRLVLTRAGAGHCSTVLEQGRNILSASAEHNDSQRFSDYIVKGQLPGDRTYSDFGETGADPPPPFTLADWRGLKPGARFAIERAAGKKKTEPKALTQIIASAHDADIRRYRPKLIVAEKQADTKEAQQRADWEMRRRIANGKKATITVNGWRQEDGRLWLQNENVYVLSRWLDLYEPLLISVVKYTYGDGGELVELELTLPDAFLPEGKRKTKVEKDASGKPAAKGKGKGGGAGSGDSWASVIKGSGNV